MAYLDLGDAATKQSISNTVYDILQSALVDKQLSSIAMPLCYNQKQIGLKNFQVIGVVMLKTIKLFLDKIQTTAMHIKSINLISSDKTECEILAAAF